MTESNPPGATPLDLPPAALKAPSNAPHPDSEEALQYGRHRVAQELDTIYPEPPPTLRARGTQNSAGRLSRRPSGTSTAADPAEAEGERARSPGAGGGQTKWLYGPVAKFWRTQISVCDSGVQAASYSQDSAAPHLRHCALRHLWMSFVDFVLRHLGSD